MTPSRPRASHTVVGIDASPTMVAAAREADPSIPVHIADAAAVPLSDAIADLAIAFMSLQDMDDMPAAIREIARLLEPAGRLCLAIVHPINSAGLFAGREPESPFLISQSYLDLSFYEDRLERDGLRMTFVSSHRPIQDYIEALADAGFVIERLREPSVPDAAIEAPSARRWQRVPLFLHMRAVRSSTTPGDRPRSSFNRVVETHDR